MNDPQYVEAARKFGERILTEGGSTVRSKVEFAFRTVTGRLPSSAENSVLVSAYRDYRALYSEDSESAQKLISVGDHQQPGSSHEGRWAQTSDASAV